MAMGVREVGKGEKKGLEGRQRWEGAPFREDRAKSTHFYSPFESVLPGLNSFLQFGGGIKEQNEAC